MIKFVIFDLDGVLVEAKEIHYEALNDLSDSEKGTLYETNWGNHFSTHNVN